MGELRISKRATACIIVLFLGGSLRGRDIHRTRADIGLPAAWPRQIATPGATLEVYQPQLERWFGNKLEAYAAVSIKSKRSADKAYGVIWFTARTEVDKANRLVTLNDFRVTRRLFPSLVNNGSRYLPFFQAKRPSMRSIPLDLLVTSLFIVQTKDEQKTYQLENEEPNIIFSTKPAVLALIDGQPEFRPAGGNLQIIINTRSLILFDQARQIYYLALMDGWVQGSAETQRWTIAERPPIRVLNSVRRAAELTGRYQVLGNPKQSLKQANEDGQAPVVYVSMIPAELLVAEGPPQFTPIVGTSLLFVENSDNDIFMDNFTQTYYILVSGRWFTSNSLQSGPWSYVTAADLPSDFAEIPAYSPKASVLVSVRGTLQASEALVANDIPQTATIARTLKLHVNYFGPPDFQPIEGTDLRYAINTVTPVVYVPVSRMYYAVQNAIWYSSSDAKGPWRVATSVPPAIYVIPPSSPIHYITYVQIYGHTPTKVFMGHTPGYSGTVVSWDNVVVYGTGWNYAPYIGTDNWVPRPHTYGTGFSFRWSAEAGWSYRSRELKRNLYTETITPGRTRSVTQNERTTIMRQDGESIGYLVNNLYADRDGNVYRCTLDSGWQQRTSHGWSPLANAAMRTSLDNWRSARASGAQRWDNFHSGGLTGGPGGGFWAAR